MKINNSNKGNTMGPVDVNENDINTTSDDNESEITFQDDREEVDAECDLRTLCEAEEIKKDPKRLGNALKMAKKKLSEIKNVISNKGDTQENAVKNDTTNDNSIKDMVNIKNNM